MSNKKHTTDIPYPVQKVLRQYSPALRAFLTKAVLGRMNEKDQLNWDDVTGAIADGIEMATDVKLPSPDPMMVERSIAAFRNGDYLTTREFVNEIRQRSRLATSNS